MDPALRYQSLKLAAAEAILAGRWTEALSLIERLVGDETALRPGVCRYCGCSELRPCGIAVAIPTLDERQVEIEPIGCHWIDERRTVCSNTRCLDLFARDLAHIVPHGHGGDSRLVRP